jgi:hypothetical protein
LPGLKNFTIYELEKLLRAARFQMEYEIASIAHPEPKTGTRLAGDAETRTYLDYLAMIKGQPSEVLRFYDQLEAPVQKHLFNLRLFARQLKSNVFDAEALKRLQEENQALFRKISGFHSTDPQLIKGIKNALAQIPIMTKLGLIQLTAPTDSFARLIDANDLDLFTTDFANAFHYLKEHGSAARLAVSTGTDAKTTAVEIFERLKAHGASFKVLMTENGNKLHWNRVGTHIDWYNSGYKPEESEIPVIELSLKQLKSQPIHGQAALKAIFPDLKNVIDVEGYSVGSNREVYLNDQIAVKTSHGYTLYSKEDQLYFLAAEFQHQRQTFAGLPFPKPLAIIHFKELSGTGALWIMEERGLSVPYEIRKAVLAGDESKSINLARQTGELMRFFYNAKRIPDQFDPFINMDGNVVIIDDFPHETGGSEKKKDYVIGYIVAYVVDSIEVNKKLGKEKTRQIGEQIREAFIDGFENPKSVYYKSLLANKNKKSERILRLVWTKEEITAISSDLLLTKQNIGLSLQMDSLKGHNLVKSRIPQEAIISGIYMMADIDNLLKILSADNNVNTLLIKTKLTKLKKALHDWSEKYSEALKSIPGDRFNADKAKEAKGTLIAAITKTEHALIGARLALPTPKNAGTRLTNIAPMLYGERPVDVSREVDFLAEVYQAQKVSGKIAIGSSVFEIKKVGEGRVQIFAYGELLKEMDVKSIKTVVDGKLSKYEIQMSMADFKEIWEKRNAILDGWEAVSELDSVKAVGVIDLDAYPSGPSFEEVTMPLLVREIKRTRGRSWGKNAKFVLKGKNTDRAMAVVSEFFSEGQDFIVKDNSPLGEGYENTTPVLMTDRPSGSGMRHFFSQTVNEGDFPDFRSMFWGALHLSRIEKLQASDKDLQSFIKTLEKILGHAVDPVQFIHITENPRYEDDIHLYAIPSIARLSVAGIVQASRMARRMMDQAA